MDLEQAPIDRQNSPSSNDADASALRVVKLSKDAMLPQRASEGAAGYDLFSAEQTSISPGHRKVVKTDLALAIPPHHYGRVAPRSGLAFKKGIDIAAGVIDSDYRGPLGIVMVNNGVEEFSIAIGDRVAQLLLERVSTPAVQEVVSLDETVRGNKGFGSTGSGALPAPVE